MTKRELLIHCNAGLHYGMGHLMRSLTLADEALARGWGVRIGGDIDEAGLRIAHRLLPQAAVSAVGPDLLQTWLGETLRQCLPDVVHLDSYWPVPEIRHTSALISNMQDGPFGVRRADLAIDANYGAETAFCNPELSRVRLMGADAALVRQQVVAQRSVDRRRTDRLCILVVIGGTDPAALTASVVDGLVRSPTPLAITVITPANQLEQIAAFAKSEVHQITSLPFTDDLPAVANSQDLVITAAGTSMWDFACMGTPMAAIAVAENQLRSYDAVIRDELAYPLGTPPHAHLANKVATLVRHISEERPPDSLRQRLRSAIDGLGAWRVVSAWEQLPSPGGPSAGAQCAMARPATVSDSRMLFGWRNDPVTRDNSRTKEVVPWDAHLAWLRQTLVSSETQLLVVEAEGSAVGTVRWDRQTTSEWEVSITVAPDRRGEGLGAAILSAGESALNARRPARLTATIHQDNRASRRLFVRAGYLPSKPADESGYARYSKWLLEDIPS